MLDWNAIDTVLLDMDGTLLDLKFDSYFYDVYLPQRLAEQHKTSIQEARASVDALHQSTHGQLNWYCTEHWTNTLNIDLIKLKHEIADRIAFKEDTRDFMLWLQSQQLDVRLVTNAHPSVLDIKQQRTGLTDFISPSKMTCSHELGLAKEHANFWHSYARRHPFDPARTLLIDDNVNVITSAHRYGVRHLIVPALPDSSAGPIDAQGFMSIEHFSELTGQGALAT